MALYQDLIMDQIKGIGEPRETKSTTKTVAEPQNEGIDIGGLMMMLMMMNMFKQPQATGPMGGVGDILAPGVSPAGIQGQQPPSPDMLGQILMALMGGGGGQAGMPIGGQLPGMPF